MSTHLYRIIDKSTHPKIFDCCFEAVIAAAIEASCTLTAVKIPMGEGCYLQRKQWRDGRKELPIFSPTGDFRSSELKTYVILLTSSMQTSASRPPRLHTPPDPQSHFLRKHQTYPPPIPSALPRNSIVPFPGRTRLHQKSVMRSCAYAELELKTPPSVRKRSRTSHIS